MTYTERLTTALRSLDALGPGTLSESLIAHDDWCPKSPCTCEPFIFLKLQNGRTYYVGPEGETTND